jgi:hypothetical protein
MKRDTKDMNGHSSGCFRFADGRPSVPHIPPSTVGGSFGRTEGFFREGQPGELFLQD